VEDAKAKRAGLEKVIADNEKFKEETRKKISGLSDLSIEYGDLKAKVESLKTQRNLLATKEANTRLFVENAMGFYRVLGEASPGDINWKGRVMKVMILTVGGAGTGLVLSLLLAFFCEAVDTTLKTVIDIERTTDLKVIASLGDLNKMTEREKDEWAFTTLTLLRGKLCRSLDGGMVCGFISSDPGEGCSTWVNLLRKAGTEMGFTVYTPPADEKPAEPAEANGHERNEEAPERKLIPEMASEGNLKEMSVATVPKTSMAMIDRAARGIWDAQARQKLRSDLERERRKMNHVMLIDLPPASTREGILLAQRFPQLVWLTRSGMADVKKTREQLKMLKAAKCKIVGAVLNQAPPPPLNAKLARWFKWSTSMILLGFGLSAEMQAQEQQPAKETKLAFSATAQPRRAAWQQRLTLGPGDTMDLSLFGQPTLTRTNIFVGPDGRLSYLQAQGILAAGLTVEELRERLDQELAKYYNSPRTMVIPVQFSSKKYYVLGKVMSKGVYSLDRPLTVLEAVARAQGLETGLYDRSSVDLADFSRSFLVRNGTREKVDFEKLFQEGDLSQNITIEPEDFLFFGSAAAREIYVLGEVGAPGPIGFVAAPTLLSALTDRGGFTDRAYKKKVLVVRGSLNKPETYVVNAGAILDASEKDFKLESRDIVYVGHRPWIKAEELLDEATQSFIQGFITAFSGVKIGPIFKNPIFGH
jgi:protein involved in polysaccharide export with SLBB domain